MTEEIEYSEEEIDPGDDARQDMLEHLAAGKPWVFVVANHAGDGIGLQVNCGGGVSDAKTLHKLLSLATDGVRTGG